MTLTRLLAQATVSDLDRAGVEHPGAQDATSSRILVLLDPDGNRVVFTGPLAG